MVGKENIIASRFLEKLITGIATRMERIAEHDEFIYGGGLRMRKLRDYVNDLFKDMPISERTESIKEEIVQNLEEKALHLMKQGKNEEDAINKVIVEFGDIEDLKEELGVYREGHENRKAELAKNNFYFSVCGSILLTALFVFINMYYSPHTIWFIYPVFGILWWPLSMYFVWLRKK